MNTQAQSTISEKKANLNPVVKTEKVKVSTSTKSSSQQTKDNIRRRNMAKYKAMSQKSRPALKAKGKKKNSKRGE